LNAGIRRFTRGFLSDEKIGGTVHLALGQSYPETGGTNQSALHWDLIVDTRTDGRITADGRTIDGHWEKSDDGDRWKLDFGLKYVKAD